MKTTIKSGNYEVLESNIFYMDNPESEVIIHLVIEDVFVGDMKINFLTMQQLESHKIEAEIENGELRIKCINFDNRLGIGTSVPIEIGYVEGKKLLLHLWSYLMGELKMDQEITVRKVEYSIYREI